MEVNVKAKRYPRQDVAPGYQINSAGDVFHNKRKVERHGRFVVIPNYPYNGNSHPLHPTYDSAPKEFDWWTEGKKWGLTDSELRKAADRRNLGPSGGFYGSDTLDIDYVAMLTRPMYRVDELVLTAFDKRPEPIAEQDRPVWAPDGHLPLFLYVPTHLNGNPDDCHLDNLKWSLSYDALEAHGIRRRSSEERKSALVNPRQGHCKASKS